ncbi:MAG: hypothetical protein EOO44_18235 [Flavobacterium sp.]|nr:MAG: hypothetical protein EOO44_18235 [Flavobacterium sp.]
MKKIISLFIVLSLLLTSCSSDDAPQDTPVDSVILVKKTVQTGLDGKIYTSEFSYDGRKIVKQLKKENDQYTETINYYYTGDLITKYEITKGSDIIYSTDITYEGNKLKTLFSKRKTDVPDLILYIKINYTYNADGTVSIVQKDVDPDTQKETNPIFGELTYSNGNVVKEIYDITYYDITTNVALEYDTKNSPYKNILGVKYLLNIGDFGYSENNNTKFTIVDTNKPSGFRIYTTTFTYNENNFPIESKRLQDGESEIKTQFFY